MNPGAADRRVQASAESSFVTRVELGSWDRYLNPPVAKDIAAHFPQVTLTLLEAEHWPQYDRPDEVARVMLS